MAHIRNVMREIRRLSRPSPLDSAQERLDRIVELASGDVDCSPRPGRILERDALRMESLDRERSGSTHSEDVQADEAPPADPPIDPDPDEESEPAEE